MKPSTLTYLLGPMGIMASPCRPRPKTSSAVGAYPVQSTVAASGIIPTSQSSPASTISPTTIAAVPSISTSASVSASAIASPSASASESATPSASPSSTSASAPAATQSTTPSTDSIDKLFKAKGKLYFGTSADSATLSKTQNAAIIDADFGQLTPENSMKWDAIEPSRGQFTFTGADALVNYATQHGQSVRGHTLLWYQQLPSYVSAITDAAELTEVIQSHISSIVGRYKGKVRSWDVVNEIFNEDGTLRDCVFTQVLGEDFVRIAFEAAHAADPDAKLYINDFHLESGTSAKTTTGMAAHVEKWLAAGISIDGIGLQGHLGGSNPDASGMQAGLEALAKTGVSELAITELDIVGAPADEYVAVTNACLAVEACVGITTWGVSDADSWLSQQTPLLFDASYQQKDAYKAIVQALS
ncbi:glycoside hydrolase family 10 protein [Whalleya microplaca]|nr:glycoside hydrolase family 10 protein [Whalleya microplaca]